jgi:lipopolysaccharide export system permease protein
VKLLDKYILKEFLKFFTITFLAFIALFLIVDFFERIRMFLSHQATAAQMAGRTLSSPFHDYILCVASLDPAGHIDDLQLPDEIQRNHRDESQRDQYLQNGSAIVMFASFTAVFYFYFTELITPAAVQKTTYIKNIEVKKQKTSGFFKQNEIWYRSDNAIYNFKMFDIGKNILHGVMITYLNKDFTLIRPH